MVCRHITFSNRSSNIIRIDFQMHHDIQFIRFQSAVITGFWTSLPMLTNMSTRALMLIATSPLWQAFRLKSFLFFMLSRIHVRLLTEAILIKLRVYCSSFACYQSLFLWVGSHLHPHSWTPFLLLSGDYDEKGSFIQAYGTDRTGLASYQPPVEAMTRGSSHRLLPDNTAVWNPNSIATFPQPHTDTQTH